ncbi:MAG: hypothetical protein ACD_23C00858G0001, partial [uncultured bacterium]
MATRIRSRTSVENFSYLFMAPSSQELERPQNPLPFTTSVFPKAETPHSNFE